MEQPSHPLLTLSSLIWMLVPSAAAQDFDQSLDALVRQRVITSQERELLRGGGSAVPMDRSRFEEACRSGALSRQDCASGVARRPPGAPASDWVRLIPSPKPLRIPVSALLARDGGTFPAGIHLCGHAASAAQSWKRRQSTALPGGWRRLQEQWVWLASASDPGQLADACRSGLRSTRGLAGSGCSFGAGLE